MKYPKKSYDYFRVVIDLCVTYEFCHFHSVTPSNLDQHEGLLSTWQTIISIASPVFRILVCTCNRSVPIAKLSNLITDCSNLKMLTAAINLSFCMDCSLCVSCKKYLNEPSIVTSLRVLIPFLKNTVTFNSCFNFLWYALVKF